ncbi:MAG: low molecular weight protein arginine phosphatase [Verrucomicrobiales bacterium]|nr:low molecular weight protein arginine phosphatase [Verrucomicrobiae bacterium]MCP5555186.1 low molecular weight protein arginine phosphatase [Akkermansiaceae bacterium]HRX54967.1 low molecular weight protein arginine phosphatase [Verrucomicrobiales bacterium]
MKKILFVCTGNICRSPMAEGLFRHAAKRLEEEILVRSAGISTVDGQPPSWHAVEVMAEQGLDISEQRSLQVTPELIAWADCIFGMTESHQALLQAIFPEATEKTFVLREFLVGRDGIDLDVPDPIGRGKRDYERTRNLILESVPSVLNFLRSVPAEPS